MKVSDIILELPKKAIFGNQEHINLARIGYGLAKGEIEQDVVFKEKGLVCKVSYHCCSCLARQVKSLDLTNFEDDKLSCNSDILKEVFSENLTTDCSKCRSEHVIDYENKTIQLFKQELKEPPIQVGGNQLSLFENHLVLAY
jgi:hypothetical protein